MKEIEILMEVKSTKDDALKALVQFDSQGIKKTLDIYFYDPLRADLQPDEHGRLKNCLRLRQKEGKNSMAYKVDHFEGDNWSHSDEHETGFDDFEIMARIMEQLGFKELVRIDNEKHIFTTSEYEIVLEDVKELGLFLEVEKLHQIGDDKIAETKDEIRNFLKGLTVEFGEEQNVGKPELMLRKRGQ
jgi:adenylate cyclase class 2